MAKARTIYICRQCGGMQHRWMGKCPDCGAWDALEEQRTTSAAGSRTSKRTAGAAHPVWDATDDAWSVANVTSADGAELAESLLDDAEAAAAAERLAGGQPRQAIRMGEVSADVRARISCGISELDRVLGGGLVPGSVVLLGGEPGIGKSSILLQAAGAISRGAAPTASAPTTTGVTAARNTSTSAETKGRLPGLDRHSGGAQPMLTGPRTVLYVSSEESARQVQQRAERLEAIGPARSSNARDKAKADEADRGADDLPPLFVLDESNLARVVEQMRRVRPAVAVIDSVQMLYHPTVEASPGSVAQLRRCATELVFLAKRTGMVVLIVGHVTKEGHIAGPRLLEHLVDVVLYFEGDQYHAHRLIRGVKNRFGSTMEIGLFEMTGTGLREVPEGIGVLPDRDEAARPGSVICPALHGSRCFLVELQALTAPGFLGSAKRKVSGLDANRLAMLIAVLEKHAGLRMGDQDVFASAVGGLRIIEPAADLPLALAIASAFFNRTLEAGTAVIGEVGLGGEVRPVTQLSARLREPLRRGYRHVVVPKASDLAMLKKELGSSVRVQAVETVSEAMELLH